MQKQYGQFRRKGDRKLYLSWPVYDPIVYLSSILLQSYMTVFQTIPQCDTHGLLNIHQEKLCVHKTKWLHSSIFVHICLHGIFFYHQHYHDFCQIYFVTTRWSQLLWPLLYLHRSVHMHRLHKLNILSIRRRHPNCICFAIDLQKT